MLSDQEKESLFLSFQMMSVSAAERLRHMSQSRVALSLLQLAYWEYQQISIKDLHLHEPRHSVFSAFNRVEPDSVHLLTKEYQRLSVIASVTTLDTFLSDLLRFLFLARPESIPEKYQKLAQEDLNEAVKRAVKDAAFGGYKKRTDSVREAFQIDLKDLDSLLPQLQEIANLRNDITHDSALYQYSYNSTAGGPWATPKTIPEVSFRTAMSAVMLVTEVIDVILVAVCRSIFGRDPNVRPLTPEVAAVHASLRAEWEAKDKSTKQTCEELTRGWLVKEDPDPETGQIRYWITDTDMSFIIQPIGSERIPIMVHFAKHKYHGKSSYLKIDNYEPVNLDSSALGNSKALLEQMLGGKEFWVEYHRWPSEEAIHAHGSLAGFADAWAEANSRTPKIPQN